MSSCPYANMLDPEFFGGGHHQQKIADIRQRGGGVIKMDDPISGVPYWAIMVREHCDYVSKHPELFSSQARTAIPHEFDQAMVDDIQSQMLINMDPPRHLKHRRITRNAFTVKAVASYEARFRQHAKNIVDAVAAKGECEFVRDVAAELPLIAILELCGVPLEDRHDFFAWTNAMIFRDDEGDAEAAQAAAELASIEMLGYAAKLAAQHEQQPNSLILSALLDGKVDGERMSVEEFQWFFLMLIVAGNESSRTVTTHMMRLLMEHPDQLQMLVDHPEMIEDAIEEALRYNTAFMVMRRTATADTELGGQQIKQGDKVVMFYHSINFDEAVFDNPMEFDITRGQRMAKLANEHRAFGVGQHFCLGSHLARLELKVMMQEIIPRLRNPRLAGPIKFMKDYFVNGIGSMPITFDPEVTSKTSA
jgi:cytochrome P450